VRSEASAGGRFGAMPVSSYAIGRGLGSFRGGSRRRVRRTSGGGQRGVGDKGCGGLRSWVWGRIVNLVERAEGAA
jgi:hypothetical protein